MFQIYVSRCIKVLYFILIVSFIELFYDHNYKFVLMHFLLPTYFLFQEKKNTHTNLIFS